MNSRFGPLLVILALTLAACRMGIAAPTESVTNPPPAATDAPSSTTTVSASPEPSPTPTPVLLDLEVVEWYEHAIQDLVDPSSKVTNVEVLIHNPNDFPVRIDWDNAELSLSFQVKGYNEPFFYIWKGWMTPNRGARHMPSRTGLGPGGNACSLRRWKSPSSYTRDVEVKAEFVLLGKPGIPDRV
jgi:hypothetical protein